MPFPEECYYVFIGMENCLTCTLLLMSANIGSLVPSKAADSADSADLSVGSRRARVVAGQGTPSSGVLMNIE